MFSALMDFYDLVFKTDAYYDKETKKYLQAHLQQRPKKKENILEKYNSTYPTS